MDTIKKVNLDQLRKTAKRKEMFLSALADEKIFGNVTKALTKTGFKRSTIYNYKNDDTAFAREWDNIVLGANQQILDLAESSLVSLIKKKHITATIFALKQLNPTKWNRAVNYVESSFIQTDKEEINMPNSERWLDSEIEKRALELFEEFKQQERHVAPNN